MVSLIKGSSGLLLHIRHEIDHHLTATLHHPKDGRSFLLQGASTSFALESTSTSFSLLALDHLWLSFMAGNHIGCVALHLIGERHRGLFLRFLHAGSRTFSLRIMFQDFPQAV